MPDLHRHEGESIEAFVFRTFHEADDEGRKRLCESHGIKCSICKEVACKNNIEYGEYHNRIVAKEGVN